MARRITMDDDLALLDELTEEQILSHIQPDEIRQRRRIRKNESDLKELKAKIENALGDGSDLVLSNREMRLLKLVYFLFVVMGNFLNIFLFVDMWNFYIFFIGRHGEFL
jgi:hypothetical protein